MKIKWSKLVLFLIMGLRVELDQNYEEITCNFFQKYKNKNQIKPAPTSMTEGLQYIMNLFCLFLSCIIMWSELDY